MLPLYAQALYTGSSDESAAKRLRCPSIERMLGLLWWLG
jgi:hypothetical protein